MVFSKERYAERRVLKNASKAEVEAPAEEPVVEAPVKERYADKRARLDAAKAKDGTPNGV